MIKDRYMITFKEKFTQEEVNEISSYFGDEISDVNDKLLQFGMLSITIKEEHLDRLRKFECVEDVVGVIYEKGKLQNE